MDTVNEKFADFLKVVDDHNRDFVTEINDFLMQNDCKCEVKSAKNGPTVSYILNRTKRTLATFVCRKTGIKLHIYPEHLHQYAEFLNTLPNKMKKDIQRASICKRLVNPDDCNPRCVMGYDFFMDHEHYQKCRYMAFMPTLNDENNPYIKAFLERELKAING
jgi:hypothetical protein